MIHIPSIKQIRVNRNGSQVSLIHDGKAISMPWEAALELARALIVQARQAESEGRVQGIIYDQAILTRLGVPFGLTRHPKVMKEAIKEACWNTQLRKYIPPAKARGIESGEAFGTPTLIQRPFQKKGE